ncbi:hypothetical protein QBC34DRAFT_450627 [Podospora aff. communis PSN243]|uniref:Uncharacterized protein n=1 Tax=Podospora aff. communis PSN243 TaxID=3040156 RepID=A0AAV9GG56_9PEZI|nr:hypothetical protein QBC34DRAFT_450627 [Podospora aff. communis PSN243]
MPASLDSSRPIMAPSNRTSVRYSTYSVSPSVAPTVATSDSATAEIRDIEKGLDRMENKALSQQRVVLSEEKVANMSKLALGAKLDRALGRRMSSQDAVMRTRKPAPVLSEKEIKV